MGSVLLVRVSLVASVGSLLGWNCTLWRAGGAPALSPHAVPECLLGTLPTGSHAGSLTARWPWGGWMAYTGAPAPDLSVVMSKSKLA